MINAKFLTYINNLFVLNIQIHIEFKLLLINLEKCDIVYENFKGDKNV
jgi:hypothetical protein